MVGFVAEAIASSLYLTPGKTSTIKWSYQPNLFWNSEHENALIQWSILDNYGGSVQFVKDSLIEESSDGTKYTITNNAISNIGSRENARINYRPLSAQKTLGGETTAGVTNWLNGERISIYTGLQTWDIEKLFERVKFVNESQGNYSIKSIQDMHNLHLGTVMNRIVLGKNTAFIDKELYLDLSNYTPPTPNNSKSVPEPGNAIALVALTILGLTSVKRMSQST